MSKFEQLLDLIVNEEKAKADELFHEIVVEMSRSIYEKILSEEEQDSEDEESEDDFEIISNHEKDQEAIQEEELQRKAVKEERPAEVVREEPVRPPPQ